MTVREQMERLRFTAAAEVHAAVESLEAAGAAQADARKSLGTAIRDALETGLSVDELAVETDLSTSTVRKYAKATDELDEVVLSPRPPEVGTAI